MPGYQFSPGSSLSGLTNNTIVKATSTSTVGDSHLTDDGAYVTVSTGKLVLSNSSPAVVASNNVNTGFGMAGTNITAILGGSNAATFSSSLLYLSLGLKLPASTKTSAYNMSQGDAFLFGDATTAGFTITLPAASGAANGTIGQFFVIQKIDSTANVVTIARAGADTINGAVSKALSAQYAGILIFGTGATTWGAVSLPAI